MNHTLQKSLPVKLKSKKRKEDAAATFTTQVEGLNKQYESYKTTKAEKVKKASRTLAFATRAIAEEPKDVEVTRREHY